MFTRCYIHEITVRSSALSWITWVPAFSWFPGFFSWLHSPRKTRPERNVHSSLAARVSHKSQEMASGVCQPWPDKHVLERATWTFRGWHGGQEPRRARLCQPQGSQEATAKCLRGWASLGLNRRGGATCLRPTPRKTVLWDETARRRLTRSDSGGAQAAWPLGAVSLQCSLRLPLPESLLGLTL